MARSLLYQHRILQILVAIHFVLFLLPFLQRICTILLIVHYSVILKVCRELSSLFVWHFHEIDDSNIDILHLISCNSLLSFIFLFDPFRVALRVSLLSLFPIPSNYVLSRFVSSLLFCCVASYVFFI